MKNIVTTLSSLVTLGVISAILLIVSATVMVFPGVTAGQALEHSAECGADINLNVNDPDPSKRCKGVEGQINECKDRTPGNAEQKDKACNPQSGIENLIKTVLNVLSAIVGAIAVIMIIIGGFRYVTSAGDSNTASSARNTILFAIVGLIIVAFAQIIVRFVLQKI